MVKKEDIFKETTLNIFTDASVRKYYNDETVGCAGAIAVKGDNIIDESYRTIRFSTNNNSEIDAIRLGVLLALKYRNKNIKHINLFSDSKISIYGLKEWIFKWINNINNEIMYSSSKLPVKNQEIFLNIIHTIINNRLEINLFHQRGHININSQSDLTKAIIDFKKNNYYNPNIYFDIEFIRAISYYNNYVDNNTRNLLSCSNPQDYNSMDTFYTRPILYSCYGLDINLYKKLINAKY